MQNTESTSADEPPIVRVPSSEDEALRYASRPYTFFHWLFLIAAIAILMLSCVMRLHGEEQVELPGLNFVLPETCSFKRIYGFGCPGCGLTRSFICLARGRVVKAWDYNPAGLFVFALVIAQIPYRIVQIRRIRRSQPEFHSAMLTTWSAVGVAVLLTVQWLWRVLFV